MSVNAEIERISLVDPVFYTKQREANSHGVIGIAIQGTVVTFA